MYLLDVYVTNASLNVNRTFTYACNQEVEKYKRVKVSFHNAYNLALVVNCIYTHNTNYTDVQ